MLATAMPYGGGVIVDERRRARSGALALRGAGTASSNDSTQGTVMFQHPTMYGIPHPMYNSVIVFFIIEDDAYMTII